MKIEIKSKKAALLLSTASLVLSGLALSASPCQAQGFKDFRALNPGLSRQALRQAWRSQNSGPGIGVVLPPDRMPPRHIVPPIPQNISNPVNTLREFRALNPGLSRGELRNGWRSQQPSLTVPRPSNVSTPALTYEQFANLNPGLDEVALRAMYEHVTSGTGGVTIGVISFPESAAPPRPAVPPIVVNSSNGLLATQNAFGSVNLITTGK